MSEVTKVHDPEFPIGDLTSRGTSTRSRSKPTLNALTASIKEFGIVEPILADEDHSIIHGEYRYEVAKKLKMETVPVIVISGLTNAEKKGYHLMAGRLVEWHQWNTGTTDKILAELDGGLGTERILGFEAPSEAGHWRDLLREIGWFIEIMPENLSASTVNLDKLALLLQNQLSADKGKYQFDDNQLLYMEGMRRQLKELRDEMLENGEITQEEFDAEVDTFDAKRELRYSVKKQQDWTAANSKVATRPTEMKFKSAADGKMMGLTQFIEFATKFGGKTKAEAVSFFNGNTAPVFNTYCDEVLLENKEWKPEEADDSSVTPTLV